MSLYRGLTAEQLEREYSPSSMVGGDISQYINSYQEISESARHQYPVIEDIQYGDRDDMVFDFFRCENPKGPLHIFIHGGYWQALSHKDSAVFAAALLPLGIQLAVINYTLAPAASIDRMIEQCGACFNYIIEHADALSVDPLNITISGHSAGAQLLMQMLNQFQHHYNVAGVRLALPISGIYDLQPLCFTSINTPLKLHRNSAAALSPMFNDSAIAQRVVIVVAENDTAEFRLQASDYLRHLTKNKVEAELILCRSLNHFDIILSLQQPNNLILQRIVTAHQ